MPWRECSVTEERLRYVARLLEGEGMSEVCREFGISRKTGYKIFNRYRDQGLDALTDRSRRPVRYANQLPDQVERLIVTDGRIVTAYRASNASNAEFCGMRTNATFTNRMGCSVPRVRSGRMCRFRKAAFGDERRQRSSRCFPASGKSTGRTVRSWERDQEKAG